MEVLAKEQKSKRRLLQERVLYSWARLRGNDLYSRHRLRKEALFSPIVVQERERERERKEEKETSVPASFERRPDELDYLDSP